MGKRVGVSERPFTKSTERFAGFAFGCLAMCSLGSTAQADDVARARASYGTGVPATIAEALENFRSSPTAEKFNSVLASLPSTSGADGSVSYIVEGDIAMPKDKVCQWVEDVTAKRPPVEAGCPAPQAAAEHVEDERKQLRAFLCEGDRTPCIWTAAERKLTFRIDARSFADVSSRNPQAFELFKTEMLAAAKDWTNACDLAQCGLSIEYDPSESGPAAPRRPTEFVVVYDKTLDKDLNGLGFFKNQPLSEHLVKVGETFFSYWKSVGDDPEKKWLAQWRHTLRHEIGHILGYGHEQYADGALGAICKRIRGDTSPSWSYDANDYDKLSIMHSSYCFSQAEFLRQAGPRTGQLSPQDKYQHQRYYDLSSAPR